MGGRQRALGVERGIIMPSVARSRARPGMLPRTAIETKHRLVSSERTSKAQIKKISSEMEVAMLHKEHLGTSRNIWEHLRHSQLLIEHLRSLEPICRIDLYIYITIYLYTSQNNRPPRSLLPEHQIALSNCQIVRYCMIVGLGNARSTFSVNFLPPHHLKLNGMR